jgi:uncharacterized membrane protein YphA (DoxX/SURF4 family)
MLTEPALSTGGQPMLATLLKPKVDLAALVLRWGIAAIFLVHGYFKLMQDFLLFPPSLMTFEQQVALGWAEVIIGGAVAIGLLSRLAALVTIVHQIGAIVLVTGGRALAGPEINRTGADYTRVGPEFNLVLIALCVGIILLGSGMFSLDHLLKRLVLGAEPGAAPESHAPGNLTAAHSR